MCVFETKPKFLKKGPSLHILCNKREREREECKKSVYNNKEEEEVLSEIYECG